MAANANIQSNMSNVVVQLSSAGSNNDIVSVETGISEFSGFKSNLANVIVSYVDSKEKLTGLLDRCVNAISNVAFVAEDSDAPRAYEVLGGLIREARELIKTRFELEKQFVMLSTNPPGSGGESGDNIQELHLHKHQHQQILFDGTTKELLEQLNKLSGGGGEKDNGKEEK